MALVFSRNEPGTWPSLLRRRLREEVFVFPTDTIYGFSCALSNRAGIERIRAMKERPDDRFIVLVADLDQARELAELDGGTETLVRNYWPGAITFVLQARLGETVAIRLPADPFTRELIRAVGEPIVSTSCNRHGERPVRNAREASEWFVDVDFFIDDGDRDPSVASTLVDSTRFPARVLRRGSVTFH